MVFSLPIPCFPSPWKFVLCGLYRWTPRSLTALWVEPKGGPCQRPGRERRVRSMYLSLWFLLHCCRLATPFCEPRMVAGSSPLHTATLVPSGQGAVRAPHCSVQPLLGVQSTLLIRPSLNAPQLPDSSVSCLFLPRT